MLNRQICQKCKHEYRKQYQYFDFDKFIKEFDIAWEDHAKVFCHKSRDKKYKTLNVYQGASWLDIRYSPPKGCDYILEQLMKTKA